MLSDIVKNIIAGALPDLQEGKTLFAGNATGTRYVLVLENSADVPHAPIECIRQSDMQVLVVGWPILDGRDRAEMIFDGIGSMFGDYVFQHGGKTDTYTVQSVTRMPPIPVRSAGRTDFSINFTLHYGYARS